MLMLNLTIGFLFIVCGNAFDTDTWDDEIHECPNECLEIDNWSAWSGCSATCGKNGAKMRTRICADSQDLRMCIESQSERCKGKYRCATPDPDPVAGLETPRPTVKPTAPKCYDSYDCPDYHFCDLTETNYIGVGSESKGLGCRSCWGFWTHKECRKDYKGLAKKKAYAECVSICAGKVCQQFKVARKCHENNCMWHQQYNKCHPFGGCFEKYTKRLCLQQADTCAWRENRCIDNVPEKNT